MQRKLRTPFNSEKVCIERRDKIGGFVWDSSRTIEGDGDNVEKYNINGLLCP